MKRKLIAIALACAMVFSMIPSLAFADVATADGIMTAIDALFDKYDDAKVAGDDFGKMDLADYEDADKAIKAIRNDYAELVDVVGGDYSSAEKKAAQKELDRLGSKYVGLLDDDGAADDLEALYGAQVEALVAKEVGKLEATAGQIYADKDELAAAKKVVPGLVKALVDNGLVADFETNYPDDNSDLAGAELAIFAKAVETDLGYSPEAVAAKHEPVAPVKEIMEAVAATYPAVGDISNLGAVLGVDDVELVKWYTDTVALYNEDVESELQDALYFAGKAKTAADKARYIEAARIAYEALIKAGVDYDYEKGLVEAAEQGYVTFLLPEDLDADVDAEYIAAVEAARAAYDKLYAFYEENYEDLLATLDTLASTGDLGVAEGKVETYYTTAYRTAYAKVKDVTEVTAENKADVEAYIGAWEGYLATLSVVEKEAIADGTNTSVKLYADKYAALVAALEVFVAAEEQAAAEEAQKQADLEAKVAIMGTKVAKVAAKAGKKKATITWKKNKNADGYRVYRATSKNGKFKAVKTTTKATTVKFVNKKLKSGKTYYYKVTAYKTIAGKKVWSKDSKIIKVKVK